MANDSTVKAGSWGARTVEKIIRIIERAYPTGVPMVYLVDSAGARITDQVDLFPGRRGAGKIFWNQVRASAARSRRCARCSGRRAAGGAYIPAFCDVVAMVEGNASMYLGSDRMVEMVTGEKTTLEAMGGARVHCAESGVGHFLCKTEPEALDTVRRYLSYLPSNWHGTPPPADAAPTPANVDLAALVPASERQAFDMRRYVKGLLDEGSFFEIHALWAREVTVGFGRLDGEVVGVVGNNSMFKGGVLFVDSADKATRFVQLCDAFNVPLLFLSDVPGFMVGSAVEKQGIIRHGAKMISAVSEATVPKICVVVRKAYGAGLYAMAGPGFEPDATLALPTAKIAVMGAEAAVNAVYANKIAAHRRRGRAGGVRRRQARASTTRTSTSCGWPASWWSTRSSSRTTCATSWSAASPPPAARTAHFSRRRHGVTPGLSERLRVNGKVDAWTIRLNEEHEALRADRARVRPRAWSRRSSATTTSGTRSRTTSCGRWARWACSGCRSPRSTAAWAATTSRCAWRSRSWPGSTRRSRSRSRPAISLGAMPIYRFGTEEQKAAVAAAAVPRRGAGRVRADRARRRLRRRRHHDPGRARRRREWVINGTKAFITNSGTDITALVTVTAVTGTHPDGCKEISTIIVPSGTPGFTVAAGLLQGRLVRLRHPRAVLRRRPGAGGQPARRARPRATRSSCASSTRAGSRSPRWRRPRAGLRRRVGRATPSSATRSASRSATSRRSSSRSPTWRCARTPPGWPTTTRPRGWWPAATFKRQAAIAKLYASEAAVDQRPRGHPGPRRLRLHERVPGGPVLARREDPGDRRGHLRGPAHDHRPRPSAL